MHDFHFAAQRRRITVRLFALLMFALLLPGILAHRAAPEAQAKGAAAMLQIRSGHFSLSLGVGAGPAIRF